MALLRLISRFKGVIKALLRQVVDNAAVKMRAGPSTRAERLGAHQPGAIVQVLTQNDVC